MYEVIGDPPAQYYFNVDPTSGLITTSRRLLPTILVGSNYLVSGHLVELVKPQKADNKIMSAKLPKTFSSNCIIFKI